MKKFLLVGLLALIPVTQGCEGLKDLNLATQDCLKNPEDISGPDVLLIPDSEVPPEILESEKFKDKKFIVAPKELLKDECTTKVPFDPSSETWLEAIATALVSIATVFFPKLALLEAILIFLSRRKRQHYADAAKAIVPYDGNVDVKTALSSIAKALGIQHSSPESKDAFENKDKQEPPQA
jgi:hypothetical protein